MLISTPSLMSAASRRLTPLALAAAAALIGTAAHAVAVTELGDAGQTQSTAQMTTGAAGALTDVFGSLFSATDADLYLIRITNPSAFSATTVNATGGTLDTQLFLLTQAGAPVEFNDDDAGGMSVLSTLPAGNSFAPVAAGLYLLGVSLSGYNPVNINNQLLFAMSQTTTGVQGPASGLQPAVLGGFFDSTYYTDSGTYDIRLTGASVATAVPEPASGLLLTLGIAFGVGAARRRLSAAAKLQG